MNLNISPTNGIVSNISIIRNVNIAINVLLGLDSILSNLSVDKFAINVPTIIFFSSVNTTSDTIPNKRADIPT